MDGIPDAGRAEMSHEFWISLVLVLFLFIAPGIYIFALVMFLMRFVEREIPGKWFGW